MKFRAVTTVVLSGLLALVLAGCNLIVPAATTYPYDPSDGVSVSLGELELRNLMILSTDGETGSLLGTAVTTGESRINFGFTWQSGKTTWQTIEITANGTGRTDYGYGEGTPVIIKNLNTPPGGMLAAVVQISGDQKSVDVPVLDGTLAEYRELLP